MTQRRERAHPVRFVDGNAQRCLTFDEAHALRDRIVRAIEDAAHPEDRSSDGPIDGNVVIGGAPPLVDRTYEATRVQAGRYTCERCGLDLGECLDARKCPPGAGVKDGAMWTTASCSVCNAPCDPPVCAKHRASGKAPPADPVERCAGDIWEGIDQMCFADVKEKLHALYEAGRASASDSSPWGESHAHDRWNLKGVSGALIDAGTVTVCDDDYSKSIRELTAERDGWKLIAERIANAPAMQEPRTPSAQPEDEERRIEERLVVTDLCDMHAFNREGRLGEVLRRAINFIEGRQCFPGYPGTRLAWRAKETGNVQEGSEGREAVRDAGGGDGVAHDDREGLEGDRPLRGGRAPEVRREDGGRDRAGDGGHGDHVAPGVSRGVATPSSSDPPAAWTDNHHDAQGWLAEHGGRDVAMGPLVDKLADLLAKVRRETIESCAEVCDNTSEGELCAYKIRATLSGGDPR